MSTNRVNHIVTSDVLKTNEQGEAKVTGTTVGVKRGVDMVLINEGGVPVNIRLDLTDAVSTFDLYSLNNLDDSTPLYVGKSKIDGVWLIEKFDETTGSKDYANESNNPSFTDYENAWLNRLTLDYVKIHLLTGV